MSSIPQSELILNEDNSVYHLNLKPGDLATKIITVGDQDRVDQVAKYFDKILLEKQSREFRTITGLIGKTPISVISTGIGTDNIDIVLNEMDALFNIDLDTRQIKSQPISLKIMRLGTSGSIQSSVPIDSIVISERATGLEGLMHMYRYTESSSEAVLSEAVRSIIPSGLRPITNTYSKKMGTYFTKTFTPVNTITATGFYAPQGRQLRLTPAVDNLLTKLSEVKVGDQILHNLEMETSGIYGLSRLLGHQAISISAILANRINHSFSKQPKLIVDKMIKAALEQWESF